MRRCYTGAQIRAAEQPRLEAGEGPTLMRRAAWGLAHHTAQFLKTTGPMYGARVVGLVGKGNNGGDTLWALTFLSQRGVHVSAVAINTPSDQLHPVALAAFLRAGGTLTRHISPHTTAVLDGVFGTGFAGSYDLPEYLIQHRLHIPDHASIIACDIPSGVLADTGQIPGGALSADLTVTFGGPKIGLLAGAGRQHAGIIRTVDIGIGPELQNIDAPWCIATKTDVARDYGAPAWDVHKYSRGVLSVAAGSAQYPGAAQLVVKAALATGVGYLQLLADPADRLATTVLHGNPQVVVAETMSNKASAVVIGPGLGDDHTAQQRFAAAFNRAVDQNVPVLVDASGLDQLTEDHLASKVPALVLTPHVGELQKLITRLMPELSELSAVEQAQAFAQHYGVWLVLKSATTYVCSPTRLRSVHPARTSELATAGTGDTLAGILGAGLSRLDPGVEEFTQRLFEVLTSGVRLHSMAGELAAADGGVVVSTLEHYILQAKRQGLE